MMILAENWYHPILATLFAFVALLLMGIILLQRGKGVGLSGAFGGAGGQQAFGSKTGDVLTWATIVVAAFFLLFAVVLNYWFLPPRVSTPAEASAPPMGQPSATEAPEGQQGSFVSPEQTDRSAPAFASAAGVPFGLG